MSEGTFEIVTAGGSVYGEGALVPHDVCGLGRSHHSIRVRSFAHDGDWVVITLSDGYSIRIPEARIERVVTAQEWE